MSKRCFFALYGMLLSVTVQAQLQVKGRVVDNQTNEPLPHASVFVSNTTISTSTNVNGEFSLAVKAGSYELIISYVGYEPIVYQLNTDSLAASYLFKLTLQEHLLNEVEVQARRDSSWYVNLEVFKENFLGRSAVARKCKLLNPEVLIIAFDPQTGVMEVKARDFLRIENPDLGYHLKYVLTEFNYFTQEKYIITLGYPTYELMRGNKAKQRRWERKRKRAYQGSIMHFVRTLRMKRLEEQGFNLRRLYREPNPERPSEAEITEARRQLKARSPDAALPADDPVSITLSRASLPKMIERLDTARIAYAEYLHTADEKVAIHFTGCFQVVYTGEREEMAYVQSTSMFHSRRPTLQTSVISLGDNPVTLEESGGVTEPLGILFEGYWSWEKVGDMLPLDYQVTSF